jgi:exodeoxyribonuclease V beta subunit
LLPEYSPERVAEAKAAMGEALAEAARFAAGLRAGAEAEHPFLARFAALRFRSAATRKKGALIVREALRAAAAAASGGPADREREAEALLAAVADIGLTGIDREGFRFLLPSDSEAPEPWPELAGFLDRLDRLRAAAARIRAEEEAHAFAARRGVILELRAKLRDWLRENGYITYDSMIENVCLALREGPERVALLRREYRYCLVDEFQDTDPLQWEIFRRAFLESGGTNPLYLIGDPKQAIYRFRGGDVYTYMEARRALFDLSRQGRAQGRGLDVNYRSSAAMVAAYNAAFLHRDWFHAHPVDPADTAWRLPAEPDPLGYLPVGCGALPAQRPADSLHEGKPIVLKEFAGDGATRPGRPEIRKRVGHWIAAEILGMLADPGSLRIPDKAGGGVRPLDWGDICVLVRKSREKDYLERVLAAAGIPVRSARRAGLYQSDAALQYLAVLESLEDPADAGKHARALLTRFFRAEGDPPPARPPASPHPLFEEWLRLAARRRWQRLFHSLLHKSGLLYRECFRPDADRAIMDYTHIGQNLVQEAIRENLGLPALVQRLRDLRAAPAGADEDADMRREASEGGKVTLMTMHVSKGLEFPVVFLASWSGNPRPDYLKYRDGLHTIYHLDTAHREAYRAWKEESEGEDRRLYYVALTRARYKLFVPLLPPGTGRSDTGPLGGFAAEALRTAAAARPDLYRLLPGEDFARPPEPLPSLPAGAAPPSLRNRNVTLPGDSALLAAGPAAASAAGSGPGLPLADGLFAGYPSEDPLAGADFARRRKRLASYSLLVRRGHGLAAENLEGRFDKDEAPAGSAPSGAEAAREASPAAAASPGDSLPRGKEVGNLLHEILEEIDFAAVGAAAAPADLLAAGPMRDLFDARLKEHRLDPKWLPEVAALIWNVLRAPLPDPAGGGPFRLADVAERRPEMEFLFPYPARGTGAGPDGYLWGFIDLVFRHRGRYYIVDWKSNRLDGYGPDALARSMAEARYDAQYKLYALAVDRWLSGLIPGYACATHFGGIYYLYLRGIRPEAPGEGIFSLRPGPGETRSEYPAALASLLSAAGAGRIDASDLFPEAP